MIQNSAYGNPILVDGKSSFTQIYLPHETQDKNEIYRIANNNNDSIANNNNKSEPQHSPDDWQMSCFQLPNVRTKTEDTASATQAKEESIEHARVSEQEDSTLIHTGDVPEVPESTLAQNEQSRPPNAFILFCKRHRAIMKNHFDEENRAITSRLGKWWRHLTDEQKEPYRLLAREHKRNVLAINPAYSWCKRKTMPTVQASPRKAETTISKESLEAAEALMSLGGSSPTRPLTTFKLADESNMGSLRELCTGPGRQQSGDKAVADQTWEQSLQVTPSTGGLMNDGFVNTPNEALGVPRASRSCKGKKYNDFMSHMYPRAQSKRAKLKQSPKPSNSQTRAAIDHKTTVNCDTADPNLTKITIDELKKELDTKVAKLYALSIDHFLSKLDVEKKRKKPQTFASVAKRSNIQPSTVSIVGTEGDTTVSTSIVQTAAQPTPSVVATVPPTSTKLVGSSKRKSPKERITHHPQSSTEQRQTIIICHKPDTSDGICHARAGPPDNRLNFQ